MNVKQQIVAALIGAITNVRAAASITQDAAGALGVSADAQLKDLVLIEQLIFAALDCRGHKPPSTISVKA